MALVEVDFFNIKIPCYSSSLNSSSVNGNKFTNIEEKFYEFLSSSPSDSTASDPKPIPPSRALDPKPMAATEWECGSFDLERT